MSVLDVRTPDGKTDGNVELPGDIFDVRANVALMHQVVIGQLAAARQGTHDTKTRGEVAGGGKKPYRQKGTGRARQGSVRAPQFTGGGVVHGPTPRDYTQRTPKKMKAAALRGALSDRARAGQVHVVSTLVSGATSSTKLARKLLESLTGANFAKDRKRVLVVIARGDEVGQRSVRNLTNAHVLTVEQLNTYDVLVNDDVVFTRDAFDALLARQEAAKARGADAGRNGADKSGADKSGADESEGKDEA